jgi:hypothetical protein
MHHLLLQLVLTGTAMAKRLRNEDFRSPKRIEDEDWETICKTTGIPSGDRERLRMRVNELVDALKKWMSNDRTLPDRKSDREQIKEIFSHINAAAARTDKLGPAGHLAFKAISPFLASMLAAQWMNESFPDDDYTPQRSSVPEISSELREGIRTSIRAPTYFIEEHSREARFQFVRQHPMKTLGAALKEIGRGLSEVLRTIDLQPRSRGGQEPLLYRHYAIVNLIEMWDEIGKQPSSGPNSACIAFCELVVVAMGWPSEGLSSAMPDAIDYWRHLPGKNNR